jgi:tellurite methyltransferase
MKKKNLQKYWDKYYDGEKLDNESSFARFTLKRIKDNGPLKLMDIGCGNGRDSFFFNKKGFDVLGVDISSQAIQRCFINSNKNLKFQKFDIEKDTMFQKFEVIYCRFFLHAINVVAENKLIRLIKNIKKKNSLVFFEYRNLRDNIFKKSKTKKHNEIIEFEKGHFRRIIDSAKFKDKFIKNTNSLLVYEKSSKNLSVVNKDNPNLTRMVFKF